MAENLEMPGDDAYQTGRAYGRPPATSDDELVRVGPGTKGGELLRRYWQPFAKSEDVAELPVKVKIFDECLVLFRDGQGRPGLLYPRCMHRGTDLIYGKVEEDGIRCCYHGWKFDTEGHCLEIPTERNEQLRHRVRQPWYPIVEKYGLLWVYMGPAEKQPEFPTFSIEDELGDDEAIVSYRWNTGPNGPPDPKLAAQGDYNWFQMYDNWMDPFHVCVLHFSINGPQFSPNLGILPEVRFEETSDGVISIQKRTLPDGTMQQRLSQVMMPNMNATAGVTDDDLGRANLSWTVAHDDTNYTIFGLARVVKGASMEPSTIPMLEDHWGPDHDRPFVDWSLQDHQRWQTDYVAQKGQGDVSLHSEEHLMSGDKGTALSRRFFRQEEEKVARGEDPVGAVPGRSSRVEVLGGNALLDPESLECLKGFAARV